RRLHAISLNMYKFHRFVGLLLFARASNSGDDCDRMNESSHLTALSLIACDEMQPWLRCICRACLQCNRILAIRPVLSWATIVSDFSPKSGLWRGSHNLHARCRG